MPTTNSANVDNLINIRVAKDTAQQAKELDQQKKTQELTEGLKLVRYQFWESVYQPLKDLIQEFIHRYGGGPGINISPFDPAGKSIKGF